MDGNGILISVIIPCYNCEEYLHIALNSVINQDCKNIELIFIDDGSTDKSLMKAESILDKSDINYKIIKQKNQGVSVARNIGIKNAIGEYVYFLDCDDCIDSSLLELVEERVRDCSADSIIFGYNKSCNGKIFWKYESEFKYANNEEKGYDICKLFLKQYISIHMCSFMIKRKTLIENDIRFRVNCYYGEDIEFIVKALYYCEKVLTLSQDLFTYCLRNNSAMQTFTEKRFTGMDALIGLKFYIVDVVKCKDVEFIELLDRRIVKEVIYIYNSELFFDNNKKNNKDIYKKMDKLIIEYKPMLKEFTPITNEDRSLKKIAKFMIINHKLYAAFRKKTLKAKKEIKRLIYEKYFS